jgi:hypothetical protein
MKHTGTPRIENTSNLLGASGTFTLNTTLNQRLIRALDNATRLNSCSAEWMEQCGCILVQNWVGRDILRCLLRGRAFAANMQMAPSVNQRDLLIIRYSRTVWKIFRHISVIWRLVSSGLLGRVALERTDVSDERTASIIRVTRIDELGTTLAVTSNRSTLRRTTIPTLLLARRFLSPLWCRRYVPPKRRFLEATRCNIPEDGILLIPMIEKNQNYKTRSVWKVGHTYQNWIKFI